MIDDDLALVFGEDFTIDNGSDPVGEALID